MSAADSKGPSNILRTAPTPQNARAASDQARAALWTGILGAAKHLGRREPLAATARPSVVQLRQGDAATRVYFIGAGLYEFHLAQLIPSDHSIFAVEISWPSEWHDAAIKNNVGACPTLEQMVALYVEAMRAHAGDAPCVLVGYSFHGSMAFEAAHQMRERCGNVVSVLLLDAPAEYPAWHRTAWQNLQDVWRRTSPRRLASRLQTTLGILDWSLIEIGKLLKSSVQQMVLRVPGKLTTKLDTTGRPMQWHIIERLYTHSLRAYRLRRLDSRGVVFRADRDEDCPSLTVDHSLGWSDLFGEGLEIVQVSGGHETMMRQRPHDLRLARAIGGTLDSFEKRALQAAQAASPQAASFTD